MTTPTTEPCAHWIDGTGYCASTTDVRLYNPGTRCPDHTPARLAGRPELVPDPARSIDGLRAAWYAERGEDPVPLRTPSAETVVDQRAKASGKRRSTPQAFRAAQAAVAAPVEAPALRSVPEATKEATRPHDAKGVTFVKALDADRLSGQRRKVWDVLLDGKWHTLRDLADTTGCPEASVSARFREFRDAEYGSQPMEAERIDGSNLFRYRLAVERFAKTA